LLGSLWFNSFSSGGGAAAYELISTTIANGTASTVSFNVSALSATYKHLQLRVTQSNTFGAGQATVLRFNSDSANNYRTHVLRGDGSTVSSADYGVGARIIVSADTDNGSFTPFITDILDPFSTTKNKTIRSFAGALNSANQIRLYSGAWFSTAAVTSVDLLTTNGNFATGSRLSIYGLR